MSHRLAGFCILASSLLIVPAANGQITTKTLSSTTLTVAPLATTSFTPYSMGSTLVGKALGLSLIGVTISDPLAGVVMLEPSRHSAVMLNAPAGLPNGNYSAQFIFSWVNQPSVVTITRGTTVVSQCSLTVQLSYASTAPTQTCDTGTLQVADGKLDLTLQVPQGVQLNLARITVNALR